MRSRPSPDEGGGSGNGDEGLGDCRELFIIAHEAAVLHDPGKGPFHHPPAADHDKPRLTGLALDHLQEDMGPLPGPAHQPTRIAAVPVSEFDERKASPRTLQDALGSVPILDVGPVNLNREQPSVRIGQDVALAAFDLLTRIIALRSPF